ncbi:hypothetical protein P872_14450 [Rhodonellum psychrophilum GCM71 = DSM 17998]|uniref:Carbohydrate deacetylase n=2 Tax=Rhodonellum TaxID=336827 RepID=U5BI94_9BACT|nr:MULTISPECIES: polysaccharide deacetylase family protein [Rhodonellum]ERM80130.1 hypothetical protein P872_14450 [Rhodonellum psychrophilum GCM71 = DSM 17998]SDZ41426.1 hypothetical protein SAMN05444412_113119 [Rhodonellum ikkaensis]
MKKIEKRFLFYFLLLGVFMGCTQTNNSQEILLIIHTDDYGLSSSHNQATLKAFSYGIVNSASIMMPCPWANDGVEYWKKNKDMDLGLHITLTNEWFTYKWAPMADKESVSGLMNENGFMLSNCQTLTELATPKEIETEMRAQIEAALQSGLAPTHLDAHMSCVFRTHPEVIASYLRLGEEYSIPPMISKANLDKLKKSYPELLIGIDLKKIPVVSQILIADEAQYDKIGMEAHYTDILQKLKPGLNVLLIHTAYDDPEMQIMTKNHDYWNAEWRQADYDYFTSDLARQVLKDNNIRTVTWREVGLEYVNKINK